ncbi:MAG TPA: hypothetical protein VL326_33665 [Kofleriaceae bacterium]|jgi:hypothetical protein|nr:hypothetical protein [Kofleriaceae bacterium]
MSLRSLVVVAVLLAACSSGSMKVRKGEPQTAREKMLAEEKKHPVDRDEPPPPGSKKWGGWRYQGDRKDCIYLVGKKCFKTENAACQAAHCKAPTKCETEGGGPATMTCKKKG